MVATKSTEVADGTPTTHFFSFALYKLAIGDYTRAIALDPTNAHAYHNRGISHDKSGAFHAAIEDFNEVLRLDGSTRGVEGPCYLRPDYGKSDRGGKSKRRPWMKSTNDTLARASIRRRRD